MKLVIPRVRLSSFKMKVLFGVTVFVGIIFVAAISLTTGNPPGIRLQGDEVDPFAEDSVIPDAVDLKTLRLVQVLFRHGDRTPIERYPKDPYNSREFWPEGWGKLTETGKLMQFRLGKYIRSRYDGYINKTYTADEIYVQSSDTDRTIQSAMANMAGMWPATESGKNGKMKLPEGAKQQFVPVHAISRSIDNKIGFSMPCPKYDKQMNDILNVPSEQAYNLQHDSIYKELSQQTGLNITSFFNVSDIYDILFVQRSHNLTLPAWAEQYFPDQLLPISKHWIKAYTFNDSMRVLRASPLVTELFRNMKRRIGNPIEEEKVILERLFNTPYAKFYVYSGHDTTLSPLLDALGVFNGDPPPYASSIYLELHENESTSDFFVKIFYRLGVEKPAEELNLTKCKSNPCIFDDFMEMMKEYILDENQWKKECTL